MSKKNFEKLPHFVYKIWKLTLRIYWDGAPSYASLNYTRIAISISLIVSGRKYNMCQLTFTYATKN